MADWRARLTASELLSTCARKVRCGADAFELRDEHSGAYRGRACRDCYLELRDRGEPLRPVALSPAHLAALPPRA